jgi:quercetin dioxygenase-like cupin family protein
MHDRGSSTKTPGAVQGGKEGYLFHLPEMAGLDSGVGYSSAHGPVVEGERIQVGLMRKARGTGARPHRHPNEQWNYVLSGSLRVSIEGEEERVVGPGTLIFFPANKIHSTVATADEDVYFLAVKDMSHGIIGMAADGSMAGPHYDPGFAPEGSAAEK